MVRALFKKLLTLQDPPLTDIDETVLILRTLEELVDTKQSSPTA